ncbi:MAG: YkgJ family cysteine cluster protein [Myxococcota bacterium]
MGSEPECETCGACCREAFDAVPVEDSDPTAARRPGFVAVDAGGHRSVCRVPSPLAAYPGRTRCAALTGDGSAAPYRCSIYDDRPAACSELDRGGEGCLFARGRLGLDGASR